MWQVTLVQKGASHSYNCHWFTSWSSKILGHSLVNHRFCVTQRKIWLLEMFHIRNSIKLRDFDGAYCKYFSRLLLVWFSPAYLCFMAEHTKVAFTHVWNTIQSLLKSIGYFSLFPRRIRHVMWHQASQIFSWEVSVYTNSQFCFNWTALTVSIFCVNFHVHDCTF